MIACIFFMSSWKNHLPLLLLQLTEGAHYLFAIDDRITFILMNYGRQWVQDICF